MTASLISNTLVYLRGRAEADKLTRALLDAAVAGQRPNCSDAGSWLWLSDEEADRAEAAKRCVGCCVFDPCGEAAEARQERWFVWGGKDYTRVKNKAPA